MFSQKFRKRLDKFDQWYQEKIAALADEQEKKLSDLKRQYTERRKILISSTTQIPHEK